jgi:flagella basal body P-ring formation protein FlgA
MLADLDSRSLRVTLPVRCLANGAVGGHVRVRDSSHGREFVVAVPETGDLQGELR